MRNIPYADLPDSSAAGNGATPLWRRLLVLAVSIAAAAGVFLHGNRPFGSTQLVAPINLFIEDAALFVGLYPGILLFLIVIRFLRQSAIGGNGRRPGFASMASGLATCFLGAMLCDMGATWVAREGVELYAFTSLSPPSVAAAFTVIDSE